MSTTTKLLTRDEFRNRVFERDQHTCVFCDQPAVDAHHILERRLFSHPSQFGGYFIDNGASVCADHHVECEMTTLSVEAVREACKITKPVLPEHLYHDVVYDKWGNPILPNGRRMKGELFHDESVQKILKLGGALDLFMDQVKYPRTHHVPWSPGVHDDDRVIKDMTAFVGKRVIVTEKMDGENTSLYSDYIHARSIDGRSHPSRDWVKQFWSQFAHDIPARWRICGENLFAKHSIKYSHLPSYFLGFSVWNDQNECLSWDETVEYFDLLGIVPVPVIYDGVYDEKLIKGLYNPANYNLSEGYVIRIADSFDYARFRHSVAKFVRENHVNTAPHNWLRAAVIEQNDLI